MWSEYYIVQREKRIIGRWRFLVEYVETRAGNRATAQCLKKCWFVHHRTAAGVDQIRRRLHHPELCRTHHTPGARDQRHMQRDDIRRTQHLVEKAEFNAQRVSGVLTESRNVEIL